MEGWISLDCQQVVEIPEDCSFCGRECAMTCEHVVVGQRRLCHACDELFLLITLVLESAKPHLFFFYSDLILLQWGPNSPRPCLMAPEAWLYLSTGHQTLDSLHIVRVIPRSFVRLWLSLESCPLFQVLFACPFGICTACGCLCFLVLRAWGVSGVSRWDQLQARTSVRSLSKFRGLEAQQQIRPNAISEYKNTGLVVGAVSACVFTYHGKALALYSCDAYCRNMLERVFLIAHHDQMANEERHITTVAALADGSQKFGFHLDGAHCAHPMQCSLYSLYRRYPSCRITPLADTHYTTWFCLGVPCLQDSPATT